MVAELRSGYELYFAYGSNMLGQRLTERVGSALPFSNAWIRGYEVRFRKISFDDSGKADLVETGDLEDIVHGVVYQFDPSDPAALSPSPATIPKARPTGPAPDTAPWFERACFSSFYRNKL